MVIVSVRSLKIQQKTHTHTRALQPQRSSWHPFVWRHNVCGSGASAHHKAYYVSWQVLKYVCQIVYTTLSKRAVCGVCSNQMYLCCDISVWQQRSGELVLRGAVRVMVMERLARGARRLTNRRLWVVLRAYAILFREWAHVECYTNYVGLCRGIHKVRHVFNCNTTEHLQHFVRNGCFFVAVVIQQMSPVASHAWTNAPRIIAHNANSF